MIAKVLSDFLRISKTCPVFFEGDNIWGFGLNPTRPTLQRITSISGMLISNLRQVSQTGQITEALKNIATIYDFDFCLCRLIPYLRFLDTGRSEDLVCPTDLQNRISSLTQEAKELELQIRKKPMPEMAPSHLRGLMMVPCAVFAGVVIPMHRITVPVTQADVTINGSHYRYYPHRVWQLSTVLSEIERALQMTVANRNSVSLNKIIAVKKCLQCAEGLLSNFCQPVKKGVYQIIYKDHQYELHYSGGKFILVTGPLKNRINQRDLVYVGIQIVARPFSNLARVTPLRANTPEGFWSGVGLPIRSNICLGKPHQYSKLRSPERTDVEALLDWLDVGVSLSTCRAAFHRRYRSQRSSLLTQKRRQITRG